MGRINVSPWESGELHPGVTIVVEYDGQVTPDFIPIYFPDGGCPIELYVRVKCSSYVTEWQLIEPIDVPEDCEDPSELGSALVFEIPMSYLDSQDNLRNPTYSIEVTQSTSNANPKSYELGIVSFISANMRPQVAVSLEEADPEVPGDDVPAGWGFRAGVSNIKVVATASPDDGAAIWKMEGYLCDSTGAVLRSLELVDAAYADPAWTYTYSVGSLPAGTYEVKVTAIDHSNVAGGASATLTVGAYAPPAIASFAAGRCNAQGDSDEDGTKVKLSWSFTIDPVDGLNAVSSLSVRYRERGASEWSPVSIGGVTPGTTLGATGSAVSDGEFDIAKEYEFELAVSDQARSATAIANVDTPSCTIDLKAGGDGIAFGGPAREDDTLDCYYQAKFRGDVHVAGDIYSGNINTSYLIPLKDVFPVGTIIATKNDVNPGTYLGGTWERYAEGRTIVGVGTSDATFAANSTGGESTHTLNANEMPSHCHQVNNHTHSTPNHAHALSNGSFVGMGTGSKEMRGIGNGSNFYDTYLGRYGATASGGGGTSGGSAPWTTYAGGSGAHNNLQPYQTAYYWIKTSNDGDVPSGYVDPLLHTDDIIGFIQQENAEAKADIASASQTALADINAAVASGKAELAVLAPKVRHYQTNHGDFVVYDDFVTAAYTLNNVPTGGTTNKYGWYCFDHVPEAIWPMDTLYLVGLHCNGGTVELARFCIGTTGEVSVHSPTMTGVAGQNFYTLTASWRIAATSADIGTSTGGSN